MRKKKLAALMLMGGILCTSNTTFAEELEEFSLDTVIVTAQRMEKSDIDTPAATTVITAADLKKSGYANVFDALEHTVGFNSMSYGPTGADIGLSSTRTIVRGLDKGTLVLVNGSPINLLNYNGSNGIPVEAVEKIEVVRGASSVLYGAEALAGVVNIITKKAKGTNETTVGGGIGNYNSKWYVNSQFDKSALYVKRDYIGDVDRTSRDNLTNASTNKAVQPYGLNKGKQDSVYFTTEINDRLSFNWSYTDLETNRPRYNPDGSNYIFYTYDDVRNNINFIYNDADNDFKSTLSYNKRRSFADKYTYSSKKWELSERYDMYGINFDNQKTWDFRDGKDSLTGGITIAREHFDNPGESTSKKSSRDSVALYASYSYENNPDFTTILGLRGEFIDDYAKDQNVILPQFQTLYKINDISSWYVNIGKSFQMAPLNQYFSKKSNNFNSLEPQQGWTYETGFKFLDNNALWKVALYHMDIQDQFVWKKNDDNTDYMTNSGDFKNTGIEVEYEKVLNDNWKYNLGISYSDPKNNESGDWKQSNSRVQAIAGVTYQKQKWTGNMNFLYLGDRETSYYKVNGTLNDVPSRIQLNANFIYQADENQTVSLNLYNILDKKNSVNKYENLDLPFSCILNYEYKF